MNRASLTASLLVSMMISAAGCATIEARPPQVSDALVHTGSAEVIREDGVHATLKQDGTTVTLVASRSCNVIERPTVLRTTRKEFENKSATMDWILAGSGVAFLGLGVGVLVDVRNVFSTDKSSRTYNVFGPAGATAIGIGALAIGVGLLATSIVDVVRANKVVVEEQEITSNGKTVREGIRCTNSPARGAPVTGKVGDKRFDLGETNGDGKLTVDIDAAIDPTWTVPPPPQNMTVLVREADVGTVDLRALFTVREGRAWERVTKQLPNCASPARSTDCDAVKDFLARYGSGQHAAEARTVLDGSSAELHRLAEDEMWNARKDDVMACANKKSDSPSEIDSACSGAELYVKSFPDGPHFKEADAALRIGRARSRALSAELERKQKAADDAERRRQQMAEAQEKARQQAEAAKEKARQQAEEAREKAQRQERCRNICLVKCSHARNEVSCLSGCTGLCISQASQGEL